MHINERSKFIYLPLSHCRKTFSKWFFSSILICFPFKWIRYKEYKFCCFSFKTSSTYSLCTCCFCSHEEEKINKKKEKRVIRVRQMVIAVVHMSNIYICEMILRKSCAQENVTKLSPQTFPFLGTRAIKLLNCAGGIVHEYH